MALRAGAVSWGIAPSRGRFSHDSCARGVGGGVGWGGELVQRMQPRVHRVSDLRLPGASVHLAPS